jgi:hypothetical protein
MNRIKIHRTRTIAAVLGVAALTAAATPATAADQVKTKIKITKLNASKASGRVKSKVAACEQDRKVKFYSAAGYVVVKREQTKTKSNGKWKVSGDFEPAPYFAKVTKAKVGDPGEKVKCEKAQSEVEVLK